MGKHKATRLGWLLGIGILWLVSQGPPYSLADRPGESRIAAAANQRAHEAKPHEETKGETNALAVKGRHLVMDLHCNACHLVEPEIRHEHGGMHGQIAPDLTFAGDKLKPEWLFDFLKGPHRIRPSVEARMPDFRLSDREALALTEHITGDLRDPTLPSLAGKFRFLRKAAKENLEAGRLLASKDYLECFKCHQQGEEKPAGPREEWAPDLSMARSRLKPDWIIRWLKDPQKIQRGTKMPSFFANADSGPEDILSGDEDKQIIALRDYLLSLGQQGSSEGYLAAKKKYPDVGREEGWKLMAELNCAGCHDVGGMHEREEIAPPLAHEGSRVRQEWLFSFLKRPHAIRPQGYIIGTSGRMPGFRLSDDEARAITTYLMGLTYEQMPNLYKRYRDKDSAEMGKRLFMEFRCDACHGGGEGSRVSLKMQGPELASVARRLKAQHLLLWLKGGFKTVDAHPLVPYFDLSEKEVAAIVAYLMTLQ